MSKTRKEKSASPSWVTIPELVTKTVAEYRSRLEDNPDRTFGWASLASACMAEAAWLVDGQAPPETVFEHCRDSARGRLEERADCLLTVLSAGEAQSRSAD
jgi:hypothetical protein